MAIHPDPYAHLDDRQSAIVNQFEMQAGAEGADLKDLLDASALPNTDKAALAQAWGGPHAGVEYERQAASDADRAGQALFDEFERLEEQVIAATNAGDWDAADHLLHMKNAAEESFRYARSKAVEHTFRASAMEAGEDARLARRERALDDVLDARDHDEF